MLTVVPGSNSHTGLQHDPVTTRSTTRSNSWSWVGSHRWCGYLEAIRALFRSGITAMASRASGMCRSFLRNVNDEHGPSAWRRHSGPRSNRSNYNQNGLDVRSIHYAWKCAHVRRGMSDQQYSATISGVLVDSAASWHVVAETQDEGC